MYSKYEELMSTFGIKTVTGLLESITQPIGVDGLLDPEKVS